MKKTALTFGLFSLVLVATSFATPIVPPTDGTGQTGGNRKHDNFTSNQELVMKNNQSSFADINQSLVANKKLD